MFDSFADDELFQDVTQEEINEDNLYFKDCMDFLSKICYNIPVPELKYYLDEIPSRDIDFWKLVVVKLIKCYKLNFLEKLIYDMNMTEQECEELKKLIWFIKTTLYELIREKMLTVNTTKEVLYNKIKDICNSKLFVEFITSVGTKNFELFRDSLISSYYMHKE